MGTWLHHVLVALLVGTATAIFTLYMIELAFIVLLVLDGPVEWSADIAIRFAPLALLLVLAASRWSGPSRAPPRN